MPVSKRSQTVSKGLKGSQSAPKPSAPSTSASLTWSPKATKPSAPNAFARLTGAHRDPKPSAPSECGRGNPSNGIASDLLASMATEFQVLGNVGAIKRHATMQE